KYRACFVSRKTYSWALVGRSVTDSGMGLGLAQMMSDLRYQPSAWRAKARRQGIPTRSLGLRFGAGFCQRDDACRLVRAVPSGFLLLPSHPPEPPGEPAYESPMFSQTVPSSRSTLRTSRNTSTILVTYSSGVDSRPSCPGAL